ncbi:MAG: hypothetical protein KC468_25050 [Myxococcales bacterium]|nr:hypothetical protein [Myxococcales bacterium]
MRERVRDALGPEATLEDELERALFVKWLQGQLSASSRAPTSSAWRWLARVQLLDDAPITTLGEHEDLLGFGAQVEMIAATLVRAAGPMVIHVDGPWGRGKSSFCRMLERRLETIAGDVDADIELVSASWFIASDRNADIVDGVLHAVARAVTEDDPEETVRILRTWGSSPAEQLGAGEQLARMSQFRAWVERELGWRDDPGAEEVVEVALGGDPPLRLRRRRVPRRLAVVFVDDLDRCTPESARAVMDAIQQFVSCAGLSFVIAADRAVLDVAFAASVRDYVGVERLGPAQALEKYIRHRVQLPGISSLARSAALNHRLVALQERLMPGATELLVGPGAWLETGVAVLLARAFPVTMTVRRLKRVLNELATTLAAAADGCALSIEDARARLWKRARTDPYEPRFDGRRPRGAREYEDFFLGQLVIVTARHVWPSLHTLYLRDAARFASVVSALTAVGEGLRRWPEALLRDVIECVMPARGDEQTPLESKKEMCVFLHQAHRFADPPRGVHAVSLDTMETPMEELGAKLGPQQRAAGRSSVLQQRGIDGTVEAAEDELEAGLDEDELEHAQWDADALLSFSDAAESATRGLPDLSEETAFSGSARAQTAVDAEARAVTRGIPDMAESSPRGERTPPVPSAPPKSATSSAASVSRGPALGLESSPPRRTKKASATPATRGLESTPVDPRGLFELKLARLEQQREPLSPDQVRELLAEYDALLDDDVDRAWVERVYAKVVALVRSSGWEEEADALSLTLIRADEQFIRFSSGGGLLQVVFDARTRWGESFGARLQRVAPYLEHVLSGTQKRVDDEVLAEIVTIPGRSEERRPPAARRRLLSLLECMMREHTRLLRLAADFQKHRAYVHRNFTVAKLSERIRREFEEHADELLDGPPHGRELATLLRCVQLLPGSTLPGPQLEKLARAIELEVLDAEPDFRRLAADTLQHSDDPAHKRRALGLYERLEGTDQWTPETLHAIAQLRVALQEDPARAGRLWELAYRTGYRDPAMQRAFSVFLDDHRMSDAALLVLRGDELPDAAQWRPFGDAPALSSVVVASKPEPEGAPA